MIDCYNCGQPAEHVQVVHGYDNICDLCEIRAYLPTHLRGTQ